MNQITGIKSVDFKITALGHGVVNWNGPTTLSNEGKSVDNHTLPKLRGYTNLTGKIKEETGFKYKKEAADIDFKETPLYISQNCIRHHLFRNESYRLNSQQLMDNPEKLLCSVTGLIRGYVLAKIKTEPKRTSPLLITDFVDTLGNGNFEQMGRSGAKNKEKTKKGEDKSNSLFSKTTFGETKYEAYASISIELLQFIPLCANFGRPALPPGADLDGKKIANNITNFLSELSNNSSPKAIYHKNYVRKGSIYDDYEAGILLNDSAIDVLVKHTKQLIENLSIRQGKGYMYVDQVECDYNDGSVGKDMLRIKSRNSSTKPQKESDYAIYYEQREG